MKFLSYILLPIQIIYSVLTACRNMLYSLKYFKIHNMKPLIISIGNLKNGGTGKTPMVEYLIRIFKDKKIAILSRGYGRQTKGFVLAKKKKNSAHDIGDENSQLYHKFKNILIAADTNRVKGVKKLLKIKPEIEIIILDDAYQHRQINRDINILLTEYDDLFTEDQLMPIGQLREHKQEAKRADIIIITKCPEKIHKDYIENKINKKTHQQLYFSKISRYTFLDMTNNVEYNINTSSTHLLITGIQNSKHLLKFLEEKNINFFHLNFSDHYNFKDRDIEKMIKLKTDYQYSSQLLMTEKDYYRLSTKHKKILKNTFKLICIEIKMDFIDNDKLNFNNQLINFTKSKTI